MTEYEATRIKAHERGILLLQARIREIDQEIEEIVGMLSNSSHDELTMWLCRLGELNGGKKSLLLEIGSRETEIRELSGEP